MSQPQEKLAPHLDLAGGEQPPKAERDTVADILEESQSRRNHRWAAAILIYFVVLALVWSVWRVVGKLAEKLDQVTPATVGLVASMVVAISVLTIALAKFAYGMSSSGPKAKADDDVVAPPTVEAIKLAGDFLSKMGAFFKAAKP